MKRNMWKTAALLALAAMVAVPGVRAADSADDLFYKANDELMQGNPAGAIKGYSQVIAEKGYSVPVLANLGEAYRRQGEIGLAILSWERARLLDPTQGKVVQWLHEARQAAGLAIPSAGLGEKLSSWMSPTAWALCGSGALAVFCVGLFGVMISRHWRWTSLAVSMLAAAVMAGAMVSGTWSWQQMEHAVVVSEGPARVAPVDTAQAVFELKPGELVKIEQRHREHVLVRNASGQTGWIPSSHADRIVAGRSV